MSRRFLTDDQVRLADAIIETLRGHPLEDACKAMTSIMAASLNHLLAPDDALDQAGHWSSLLRETVEAGQRGELADNEARVIDARYVV